MSFDPNAARLTLAVVGAGVMGRGIAQIAAQAGLDVRLFDAQSGAAARARAAVDNTLAGLQAKGRISGAARAQAIDRITVAESLSALAGAQVVIEAIVEDLAAKQALMRDLEKELDGDCVIATNTSSLSVTAIASVCLRPQRVAGFHFFNPVPLMKLVEVIDGLRTDPAVSEALLALGRRMGHTAVRAKDTPGFIVNHAGRGYGTEALRLLGENIAGHAVIDDILRGQAGFRLGPFELFDLIGLDVSHPVMESIYHQYYEEPRFRPSVLAAQRRAAGLLGRKSGEGFYRYEQGQAVKPPAVAPPTARLASVWVSRAEPVLGEAAVDLLRSLGTALENGERPGANALCVVTPLGEDVTHCCVQQQLDPARTVALDLLFPNDRHRTLMLSPLTRAAVRDQAHGMLAADGVRVSVVRDSCGLVAQRVLAVIVNIGCDIAQQGIATPEDIDRAVMLGLGYPHGPLAWGDRLGAATVLRILERLLQATGDPRYRSSAWLRRRAQLGISLSTPEAAI